MSSTEESPMPEMPDFDPGLLPISPLYPPDPGLGLFSRAMPFFAHPHEFTGWQDETLSWKRTCYLSANLNPGPTTHIHGPDAIKFLSDVTAHSFANFPVGRCRHTVLTNDEGLVMTHGLALHAAENEIHTYFLSPWLDWRAQGGSWDIELVDRTMDRFVFQLAGPRCLEALESAAEADLHDLRFMAHGPARIDGCDVRILRMGMGGTLSYEIHGDVDDAQRIYARVLSAGEPVGMRRLGWHSYANNHTENGYPQMDYHFQSCTQDPGLLEFLRMIGFDPDDWPNGTPLRGSSGTERSKRFRNPLQCNWDKAVSFDHEFPGKAALQREAEHPTRRTVTLVWNVEDVIDVYASQFQREQDPYRFMEIPIEAMFGTAGGALYQDDVLDEHGNVVGCSSGREYSNYSRDMFSLGCIDVEKAELGTELQILWGEPGTRQKKVRATVSKFPHLDLTPNYSYDVESIPRLGG